MAGIKCYLGILLCYVITCEPLEESIVNTKNGTLKGFQDTSVDGRQFMSFLGIPFAKPPIGKLRFMDPEVPAAWKGVRDATTMPEYCLQKSFILQMYGRDEYTGTEDCLYLNVYTPTIKPKEPLPVMVFFHGGGFTCGGAQEYSGHSFMDRDVILVIPQYRVGVFGFYYKEQSKVGGNYGMKDQTMALRWVQENIAQLGGDPERVTIFGESAGAVSVHYHMLSPLSKGLFHRAILQSGNVLSPYAFNPGSNNNSVRLSEAVGCADSTTHEFLACLQLVDGLELLKESYNFEGNNRLPNIYSPRVDGHYLLEKPVNLIKTDQYNKVDLILGVTQDESASIVLLNDEFWDAVRINTTQNLHLEDEENKHELVKAIEYKYFGDAGFSEKPSLAGKQMIEDYMGIYGYQITALLYSRYRSVDTYMYEFKFRPEFNIFDPNNLLPENLVDHTTDLVFLFVGGGLFNKTLKDDQNIELRQKMLDLWANFATYGDPTPNNTMAIDWKPAVNGELNYLEIKPKLEMNSNFRQEAMHFWTNLPLRMNYILFPKRDDL